ncbi:MAG: hypothetical protein ACK521_08910 [bacterium]
MPEDSMIEVSPMPLVVDEMEMVDASIDSKMAPVADEKMSIIYHYVADWIKAVLMCVILAIVFFVQFHTTDVMFKWFTTTPI